jgi:astacin
MRTTSKIGLALFLAGGLSACDGAVEGIGPSGEIGGAEGPQAGEICYRGQRVWAQKLDGDLVVEGDILVYPEDQWCEGEQPAAPANGGADVQRSPLRIQGAGYQWPGGVVPYAFDSSFTAGDQTAAVAAMKEWSAYVPTIRFVARTTESDYIYFTETTLCQSGVGHGSGKRTIKLAPGCIGNHSLHHEIGHSLGLFHQQTRKDRDTYVRVTWSNISGCPSTATQSSDCGQSKCAANIADCGCSAATDMDKSCYTASNFATDSKRSDIGPYDYDSVMHYSRGAFSKGGGDTLTVLKNDSSGTPFPIGQRSHLSDGDIYAMQSMYPMLTVPRSMFSGLGSQRVCALVGRSEDIAVRFSMAGSSAGVSSAVIPRSLTPGDYTVACQADSSFWASNYDYPNSTTSLNTGVTLDSYSTQASMRVLTPALLAVF